MKKPVISGWNIITDHFPHCALLLLLCPALKAQEFSRSEIRAEMERAHTLVEQGGPYSLAQRSLANLIPCQQEQVSSINSR